MRGSAGELGLEDDALVGRLVIHPRWGNGRVVRVRHGGYDLFVLFEDGQLRVVSRTRVQFRDEPKAKPVALRPAQSLPANRVIVEALKLGIVPEEHVEQFMFGRDDELAYIDSWLDDPGRSVLLLVGSYGAGKSHLLEFIRRHVLNKGFASAVVQLDANEAPLHRPKQVYRRLMETLRFRDEDGKEAGFASILRNLAKGRLPRSGTGYPMFLTQAIEHMRNLARTQEEERAIVRWIMGQDEAGPLKLHDFTTWANVYCHILSGIGHIMVTSLGLRGLVLVVDEAEVLDMTWGNQYISGSNFLAGLILTCSSATELLTDSQTRSGTHWQGVITGLIYGGHSRETRYLWKQPSGLKMILAMTPPFDESFQELRGNFPVLSRYRPDRLDLEPLSDEALVEAFRHLARLYADAFPCPPPPEPLARKILSRIGRTDGRSRLFLKASVEAMDLIRHYPNQPWPTLF